MNRVDKLKRIFALALILLIIPAFLTGCWNYKEIEQLAIVSAVAIDKIGPDKVLVTVEIVSVEQGAKSSSSKPVYIQATGKTFFETIRSMVAIQGKKLYWSHAKALIVSEDIAKDGITKSIDFFHRDAEIREDMWILISREKNARSIFDTEPITEKLIGFEIDDTMRAQEAVSRFPSVELYKFFDNVACEASGTTVPVVSIINVRGIPASFINGAAVLKGDKLLGYLDETDTKSMLWVLDELKGGIYPVKDIAGTKTDVSLEIFRSRTKVKPHIVGDKLVVDLKITTDVNIGEILGNEDFISEKQRGRLELAAEAQIGKDIESLIKKAQKQYKYDFLGFGKTIKRAMPDLWKGIEKDWPELFQDIETKVDVDVRIKGSATTKKPIKVGK